jgi:hypothetical protein
MSLRSEAIKQLESKIGKKADAVYTSKYYQPKESWTKTAVWWLEIPVKQITEGGHIHMYLVCEVQPDSSEFHFLQVPIKFFNDNLHLLESHNDRISLFLSAETATLFSDQRGSGKVSFLQFLLS